MDKNRTASCSCVVNRIYGQKRRSIKFCPLHESAGELLSVLKAVRISLIDDEYYKAFKPLLETVEAAIDKAEGKNL